MTLDDVILPQAALKGPWWWRVRRAYKIPDLVTNDTAFKVIVEILSRQPDSKDFYAVTPARALVFAFVALGDEGKLDDIFFDETFKTALWIENVDRDPVNRIKTRAAACRIPAPQTNGSRAAWDRMTNHLLSSVRDSVSRFPYDATNDEFK